MLPSLVSEKALVRTVVLVWVSTFQGTALPLEVMEAEGSWQKAKNPMLEVASAVGLVGSNARS